MQEDNPFLEMQGAYIQHATQGMTQAYVLERSRSYWRWMRIPFGLQLPATVRSVTHSVMSFANAPDFVIDPSIEQMPVGGSVFLLL